MALTAAAQAVPIAAPEPNLAAYVEAPAIATVMRKRANIFPQCSRWPYIEA